MHVKFGKRLGVRHSVITACKVWEAFGCKTFRDYHELYNRADVLQLADIFENFRNVCLKHYKLDP
jgi:hypothetical protein